MAMIAFRSILASPDNTSSHGRMPLWQLLFMESLYLYRHSEDCGPAPQVVDIVSRSGQFGGAIHWPPLLPLHLELIQPAGRCLF